MKRKKIEFQKLVNIHSYPLPVQMDVFQWMMSTGWEYRGRAGVFEILYGLSSHGSQSYYHNHGLKNAETLRRDLTAAFVRAIVATDVNEYVKAWRLAEGISLGRYRMLAFSETSLSYGVDSEVWRLFSFVGKSLSIQLNEYHPAATHICQIRLTPDREGWQVVMRYEYPGEKYGSGWDVPLLPQRTGFADAVIKATAKLKELTLMKEA